MALSWKDGAATLLVAAAAIVTYARLKAFSWPLLGSWRMGTLILLVLGLGTCILIGSGAIPTKDTWMAIATTLGVLALGLSIIGLAFNSKLAFLALAADILALWVVATIHHIVGTGG